MVVHINTALYLLSILSHDNDITIYWGVWETGNVQDVFDGLNVKEQIFMTVLMENVKFPGSKVYDDQIEIHNTTQK